MYYGVISGQGILQEIRVADITGKKPNARGFCFGKSVPRNHGCLNTITHKALDQRPADKATPSEHHDTLHPLTFSQR